MQSEKYIFWKEVVRNFALKLNSKNRVHLVRLYWDFEQKDASARKEAILEVYHQFMSTL